MSDGKRSGKKHKRHDAGDGQEPAEGVQTKSTDGAGTGESAGAATASADDRQNDHSGVALPSAPSGGAARSPQVSEAAPASEEEAPGSEQAAPQPEEAAQARGSGFPIAALGASAGGLEALQAFFEHMPVDAGVGFVVVTHMHPEHTSMMPELLSHSTAMPVVEAGDGQRVEPNHVYVAPPGDNLTIANGLLRRADAGARVHLPIDHFLRALAEDQQEWAVAIILSGTGTDGTLGLQAVKGAAGMAMVQTPVSAKFAGMPTSADAAGLADFKLPPAELAGELAAYAREFHTRVHASRRADDAFAPEALRQILSVLRQQTGNDFTAYKTSTIQRRIERRMNVHRIQAPNAYARYLKENQHEASLLFRELLITVTRFFRDGGAFEALAERLTELLHTREEGHPVRVWVPGCATGEEAYSVAITLDECMNRLERAVEVQIFATDLDPRAIDTARAGVYPSGIAADVSAERLKHYFTHDHDTYRVNKNIREMCIFAPQNVLSDPPFTRLDLIVCRNLLIYFASDQQKELLPTFFYALRPGGLLFLGTSETVGLHDGLFELVDRKWKIYRRREGEANIRARLPQAPVRRPPDAETDQPSGKTAARPAIGRRLDEQIQRVLLERFAPTSIVVQDSGDIVHIQGRTGKYLEPAEGSPSHNVFKMARRGLAAPLSTMLRRAAREGRPATRDRVSVQTNSDFTEVDVQVVPLNEPEALRGLYLVTLAPSAAPPDPAAPPSGEAAPAGDVARLEEELNHTRESLQSTVEELESSNEELQSMNEELQSSNEELETSKEEMQSLNEELNTVNAELNGKIAELSHANDDMHNLLNAIDVASIFLDTQLHIARYTDQARDLIRLVPGDVGRPLDDLAVHVEYPRLFDDCRHVLHTLERREAEVRAADGRWFLLRVLPYRTSRNVIDGVVVTFVSLERIKRAESGMQYFRSIVETVREPLIILDADFMVRSANAAFYAAFDDDPQRVEGRRVYELGDGQWDIPELRRLLEEVLPDNHVFNDFPVEYDFPRVGRRRFILNARRIPRGDHGADLILLAMEEVGKARD